MSNVVKFGAIFIGACVALFVVAVLVFSTVVDPNDYKDRISKIVNEETGRTLVFDGDLDLLLFPDLGIEMGGVSLSNNPEFGTEPMVRVASARVSVRVFPLLLGKVKFGSLQLDGLILNMGRARNGSANWDDIVGRTPVVEESKSDGGEPFSLDVAGVSVTNGSVVWDDRQMDTRFVLQGISLSTGRIAKGSLFPVDMTLAFDCSRPDARGTLKLSGKSSIDFENREYGHMDMRMTVEAQGDAIPGGKLNGTAFFNFLAMNFNREHAQITGLDLSAYGVTVHLDGTVEGITQGVKSATGVLTVDPFDVTKALTAMGESAPETADAAALSNVGGMVDFSFVPGQIELKTLTGEVDGTRIVGNGRVERGGALPACFARLDVGEIDLDRYLPPEHSESTKASKEAAASGARDDLVLPVDVLRELDLDVEAKVSELKLADMRFQSVKANLKAKDGLVTLSPVAAEAYGGTVSLTTVVSAVEKTPMTDLSVTVHKVDIGALARDVDPGSKYAGIADFDAKLVSRGARMQAMRRTVQGKASFHLADGVFPGVNLIHIARETHSRKGKGGKVEGGKEDETRFGSIKGSCVIRDGIVHNDDLKVMAPGLRADGQGAVSLVSNEIDYMIKAKLVPQAGGQGGQSSEDLFGVLVPVHVTGTLENPQYWVSVTEYVKALGGAVIGVAGSVFGGVKSVIKGVGSALDESCCEEKPAAGSQPKRKKFLGIF